MTSKNNPGIRHHELQCTSTSVVPNYRLPSKLPVAPVFHASDQLEERPQISQRDILRKRRFEESIVRYEGTVAKRTEVTSQKQLIEIASSERRLPLSSLAEPSPQLGRSQNLGTRDEALHSHPVLTRSKSSAEELPKVDKRIKRQRRETAVYKEINSNIIIVMKPPLENDFPDPANQQPEEEGEGESEQTVDSTIPVVRLIPPPEGNIDQVDLSLLSTSDAWKASYKQSERESRRLKRRLAQLEPIARLAAEVANVDVHDSIALDNRLKAILQERSDLKKLLPLAEELCAYLGIQYGPEAFDALPGALREILGDLSSTKGRLLQMQNLTRGILKDCKCQETTTSDHNSIAKDQRKPRKVTWGVVTIHRY